MLLRRILEQGASAPERTALVCGRQRLSHGALAGAVTDLAGRLAAAGVRPGDRVVVLLPNGVAYVTAFLALAALRAVAIPLSTSTTRDEFGRYCEGFGIAFVLSQSSFGALEGLFSPAGTGPRPLLLDALPRAAEWRPAEPYDGPALCQFSSGSTGQPKRVVRTQRHLVSELAQMGAAARVGPDDAIFCALPLYHAHGLGNGLLLALGNGARLVLLEPRFAADGQNELPLVLRRREMLDLLENENVTILPGVPFFFALLAETAAAGRPELALRLCFIGGSALPRKIYDRFLERFGVPIRQQYGCTEAGSVAINLAPDTDASWDSVGRPLPGCEMLIDGTASGMAEGEVAIRSAAMCDGYSGQPELTAEYFLDGWFRPGDLARRDAHGDIRMLGRIRPFIVSAGYKIDPAEVEGALLGHPAVSEAAVVGVGHPTLGELVKAFVVMRDGRPGDEAELTAHCRQRLEEHKLPKAFRFLERLPRTALGKISIRTLQQHDDETG